MYTEHLYDAKKLKSLIKNYWKFSISYALEKRVDLYPGDHYECVIVHWCRDQQQKKKWKSTDA